MSGKYFLTSSLFFKYKSLSTNCNAWLISLGLNLIGRFDFLSSIFINSVLLVDKLIFEISPDVKKISTTKQQYDQNNILFIKFYSTKSQWHKYCSIITL